MLTLVRDMHQVIASSLSTDQGMQGGEALSLRYWVGGRGVIVEI